MIIRKSPRRSSRSRRAGALVAETIALVGERLEPGITTLELDHVADEFIRANGGIPTSLGYKGYPRAICISPNDVVVHGIPDAQRRRGGRHGHDRRRRDARRRDRRQRLHVRRRRRSTPRRSGCSTSARTRSRPASREARLGNRIGDISHAVQTVVEGAGFSVVKSLVGHGVGRHYHEDPQVPNFGEPGRGPGLSEGMTIAIEPMITMGGPDVWLAEDELDDLDRRRLAARPTSSTPSRSSPTARGS